MRDAKVGVIASAQSSDGPVHVEFDRSAMDNMPSGFAANGSNAVIGIYTSGVNHVTTVATTTAGGSINTFGNKGILFFSTLGPLTSVSTK